MFVGLFLLTKRSSKIEKNRESSILNGFGNDILVGMSLGTLIEVYEIPVSYTPIKRGAKYGLLSSGIQGWISSIWFRANFVVKRIRAVQNILDG